MPILSHHPARLAAPPGRRARRHGTPGAGSHAARRFGLRRIAQAGRRLTAVAVMAVLASGAGLMTATASAEPLTMAVSLVPYSLTFFVAQANGYFAAEKADVRIVDCFPGKTCLTLLLDGKADLATAADVPIVYASFLRRDFAVVATVSTSSNDARILGRRSRGTTGAAQLAGKRVGVVRGTSGEYFLDTYLLFHGVDPARVAHVYLAPGDVAAALVSSDVDAIAAFQPMLWQAANLAPDAVLLPNPKIHTTTFNLVATRRIVGRADDDIAKILRALRRAEGFIAAQPAAARKILRERLRLDEKAIAAIFPNLEYELGLDQMLVKTFESEARWFGQQADMQGKQPGNYLDFIHTPPLAKVAPAAITLVK